MENEKLIKTAGEANVTIQQQGQQLALYHDHHRLIFGGVVLTLGVIGNFLALIILARKPATKKSKYTLMLRCLSMNNLIGLLGMLTSMLLQMYLPKEVFKTYVRWDCAGKVVWRFFGLSSGCIAAVMAIERWMALARPFIYHKHITYEVVRKTLKSLVVIAVIITFLPFFGFGAYKDESNPHDPKCIRYRDAVGFWNKLYSMIFMIFGSFLCIVIVACNMFVIRVLCFIGRTRISKRQAHYDLVNRDKNGNVDTDNSSGSSLHQHHSSSVTSTITSSSDEIKFAKLMTFLSISFVICWMPQMIAIPMAIIPNRVPKSHPFFIIADVLMALHFTSDPYVYVISRTNHSYIFDCIKQWRYGLRRSPSDQSRLRTTVEQYTIESGIN